MRTVFLPMLDQGRDGVLGLMIPDRTKVKTDAALDNNSSVATLDEQIIRMLAEAEAIDARQQEKIEESRLGGMPKGSVRLHAKLGVEPDGSLRTAPETFGWGLRE
jgi:hypothetical protein